MFELLETILSFPTQGHYGYPIRIDVFNAQKEWECGVWSDKDSAISFLFDKCELFDYKLYEWYRVKDELYIVIGREGSSDAED